MTRNPGADLVREARIQKYDVLDRLPPHDLQSIVDLAAEVCGVPFAAINLITRTEQHQIAAAGIEPSVCAREDSMCAAVLGEPMVAVPDASQDARFAANPFVTGEIGDVRFYASAPLVTPDGLTVGRLCVFDDVPHTLSQQEQDAVGVLARHVSDLLELRMRTSQLESSLAELTRTRDELRRSNDNLAAFAGQISHDLRNPLTAIVANADFLAGDPAIASDPALASLASELVRASLRMDTMIEEVLGYAKVAGRLHQVDTDLDLLVTNVLNDLAPRLRERGASVHVGALPTVKADGNQLYVVLLNLIDNAVKYSGDGRPEITVGCQRRPGWCRVSVRDEGIGIPADRLEDVFEPYVRVEDSNAGAVEGCGIGLDTVRRIIEAHGGRLGIDSEVGVGSTVWFELPDG